MTVLTVNRRKNMLLRHTISNGTLECRFGVYVNVTLKTLTSKRNMKKLSVLRRSSHVQACRPIQAKLYKNFKHFQNQRGTNSATMHVKRVGGVLPFRRFTEKKNEIQRLHSISFYLSVVVWYSFVHIVRSKDYVPWT